MDLLRIMLLYMAMLTGSATGAAGATPIPYAALHTPTPTPVETPAPTDTPLPTASPTPTPTATPRPILMRNGSTGSAVRTLQGRLQELGYLDEDPDGFFGTRTEEAVKAFQKNNGLDADGIAGIKTLDKLYNDPDVIPASTAEPQS